MNIPRFNIVLTIGAVCLARISTAIPIPRAKTVSALTGKVNLIRTPNNGIQPQALMDDRGALHLIYFAGEPSAGDIFLRPPRTRQNGLFIADPGKRPTGKRDRGRHNARRAPFHRQKWARPCFLEWFEQGHAAWLRGLRFGDAKTLRRARAARFQCGQAQTSGDRLERIRRNHHGLDRRRRLEEGRRASLADLR